MCTVIYYPFQEGALLSSCRDEAPVRSTALPVASKKGSFAAVYSKDTITGGTWAGMNEQGVLIILLNGAFEKHTREKQYRKSRGLIVKELLFETDPLTQWKHHDFEQVEPFTLIIWSEKKLYEAVWDGRQKHLARMDGSRPHIWSSSTLYNTAAKALRKEWFDTAIRNNLIKSSSTLHSFLLHYADPQNGFIMNRHDEVVTLSISIFEMREHKTILQYYDMTTGEKTGIQLFNHSTIAP